MTALVPAERVLIFAKAPVPGQVKTRLEPLLGPDRAARLHEAFLRDVLARARARIGSDTVLYHHPEHPGLILESLDVTLAPQRGSDLGERMASALTEQEEAGVERVVILGSDSPDLPPAALDRAFAILHTRQLVLGPAVDGGYWLVGARGVPRAALTDIPWGTDAVLSATLAAVQRHGLDAGLLDVWYDVDRPDNLRFLKTHLDFLLHTAREDRCPITRRLLDEILELEIGPGRRD